MDASIRRKSLGLTVLIHGVILLALFFFAIHTRIPPFEEGTLAGGGGGATLVDFGEVAVALDASASAAKPNPFTEEPAPAKEDEVMTSDVEETTPVVVHKNEKVKKIKENKVVVKKKNPVKEVVEKKVEIRMPTVDPKNLFHARSQGSSTSAAAGDQGQPNGVKNGGLFPGMGGTGTGTGTGNGTGSGPGIGAGNGPFSGISWGAGGGRSILSAPQFKSKTNEPGKVTLKIFVDENGNVTRAERYNTQTLNAQQVDEALEYAKKVKFSKGSGLSIAYPTIEFSAR